MCVLGEAALLFESLGWSEKQRGFGIRREGRETRGECSESENLFDIYHGIKQKRINKDAKDAEMALLKNAVLETFSSSPESCRMPLGRAAKVPRRGFGLGEFASDPSTLIITRHVLKINRRREEISKKQKICEKMQEILTKVRYLCRNSVDKLRKLC